MAKNLCMDIKKIIDDVTKKITSNASLLDKFKADPVTARRSRVCLTGTSSND